MDGEIRTGDTKYIDLNVSSAKNNIQALVAVLPQNIRDKLSNYKSKGKITFEGSISGDFSDGRIPAIQADFNCNDVEFYYPGYRKSFKKLNFSGSFTNGSNRNLATSVLMVKNFSGILGENEIKGDLSIANFKDMSTTLDLSGKINLSSFLETFPVRHVPKGGGDVDFDIKLTGRINDLKNKKTNSVKASGDISMKNVNFRTAYSPLEFRKINGRFSFNNLDLAIERFSGQIGESDFNISGFFKNIIPFVFYRGNPIKIIADLESSNLNLNELLTLNFSNEDSETSPQRGSAFPFLDSKRVYTTSSKHRKTFVES